MYLYTKSNPNKATSTELLPFHKPNGCGYNDTLNRVNPPSFIFEEQSFWVHDHTAISTSKQVLVLGIEFYVTMRMWNKLPTIAAAAGDQDVRRRGLSWAWAEGVQTVERVLAAVAWRGERVAALGVPAVDVATVPDAAFRALCLLCLLNIYANTPRLH